MLNRTAQAIWEGNLKDGRGTVEFGGRLSKRIILLPLVSRTAKAPIRKN